MLAAWIAWPDAPLVRLSSAAIASTVSVRASKRTVTCTTLAPYVALVPDGSSTTTTHGSLGVELAVLLEQARGRQARRSRGRA